MISWKNRDAQLSISEYREMVMSDYVKKSLNPRIASDVEETARLAEKFSDRNKFLIHKGVALWILDENLRPVPMDVAYYARFLGYEVCISKHREMLRSYEAQSIEEYRRARENSPLSEEERYEIAAAFGEDATVIDVLTGEIVQHGHH